MTELDPVPNGNNAASDGDGDTVAWPCSGFPGYARLTGDGFLRESLLAETGGGEAFVARAAAQIRHFVLDAEPYQTHEGRYAFSQRLHREGHSSDAIARALAQAWLAEVDVFYLPRLRKRDYLKSRKALLLTSLSVSLGSVIIFILYIRMAHPKLAAALLGMEPVLAAGGMVIAVPLFLLLERLAGHGRHKP